MKKPLIRYGCLTGLAQQALQALRRLLRCLDTHFGLHVEHAHKLLHMQQFLRADGRPLPGNTLQQLAQLFQNILAGDPFALEDGLGLRHLLPGGDISATGCGGLPACTALSARARRQTERSSSALSVSAQPSGAR